MPKLSSSYAVRPKLPTIARPVPGLGSCRLYIYIYIYVKKGTCVCVYIEDALYM